MEDLSLKSTLLNIDRYTSSRHSAALWGTQSDTTWGYSTQRARNSGGATAVGGEEDGGAKGWLSEGRDEGREGMHDAQLGDGCAAGWLLRRAMWMDGDGEEGGGGVNILS